MGRDRVSMFLQILKPQRRRPAKESRKQTSIVSSQHMVLKYRVLPRLCMLIYHHLVLSLQMSRLKRSACLLVLVRFSRAWIHVRIQSRASRHTRGRPRTETALEDPRRAVLVRLLGGKSYALVTPYVAIQIAGGFLPKRIRSGCQSKALRKSYIPHC